MDATDIPLAKRWAVIASNLNGEIFDACKHLIDNNYTGINPLVRFVNTQLFIGCHLTSESMLILTQLEKVWDADILCRSVLEGTVKHAFMLQGADESLWLSRCQEYWYTHPNIMLKKDCSRAKDLRDIILSVHGENASNLESLDDMVYMGEQLQEFLKSTTKESRRAIDKRWSLSGILEHFSNSSDTTINVLRGLFYRYGNSCHLSHMDGIGIANIWDRYLRNKDNQEAITLSHSARLVSDTITFTKIRFASLKRACKEPITPLQEIDKKYQFLFSELQDAHDRFNEMEYEHAFSGVREQIIKDNSPAEE